MALILIQEPQYVTVLDSPRSVLAGNTVEPEPQEQQFFALAEPELECIPGSGFGSGTNIK
jgi:hypothetical protein